MGPTAHAASMALVALLVLAPFQGASGGAKRRDVNHSNFPFCRMPAPHLYDGAVQRTAWESSSRVL